MTVGIVTPLIDSDTLGNIQKAFVIAPCADHLLPHRKKLSLDFKLSYFVNGKSAKFKFH